MYIDKKISLAWLWERKIYYHHSAITKEHGEKMKAMPLEWYTL